MKKTATFRVDAWGRERARELAAEDGQSLSQWVGRLVEREIAERDTFTAAREHALRLLREKIPMRPGRWSREALHERHP